LNKNKKNGNNFRAFEFIVRAQVRSRAREHSFRKEKKSSFIRSSMAPIRARALFTVVTHKENQ
jgi:hypothetical protein